MDGGSSLIFKDGHPIEGKSSSGLRCPLGSQRGPAVRKPAPEGLLGRVEPPIAAPRNRMPRVVPCPWLLEAFRLGRWSSRDLMVRFIPPVFASTCLLLLGVGCDTRTKECNRLVRTVEEHLPELQSATESLATISEDPAVAARFVATVQSTRNDIAESSFEDPELNAFRDRYDAMLERAQETATALAAAAENRAEDAYGRAVADARDVTRTEAGLAREINTYCQAQ